MEGSPIELALGWVSELGSKFDFDFAKGKFNTGVFSDSPSNLTEREEQFITMFGVSAQIMPNEMIDFCSRTHKSSSKEIEVVDMR